MATQTTGSTCVWLGTGQEVFPAMLAAIDAATHSVFLESYIYSPGALGDSFRAALVRAAQRGVRVRVLVDALGSYSLPASFWQPLSDAQGEARFFNPLSLNRIGIRNHRKLLVCDQQVAFVGGFNIAPEYEGDGVARGWRDVGIKLGGPLVTRLAESFEEMFARAGFQHKRFPRLRRLHSRRKLKIEPEQLLVSGPDRPNSPIKAALRHDLAGAKSVQIVMAYFLPTGRLRRQMLKIARHGGRVQLILPGKSDVVLSRLAAQSFYRRFLQAGVEIYEYQPQILHAKLLIIDEVVYLGSANLDPRSLSINYELMLRFQNRDMARQGREVFDSILANSSRIVFEHWCRSRSLWQRIKQRWAYFLLARIDPYIARSQWQALPD